MPHNRRLEIRCVLLLFLPLHLLPVLADGRAPKPDRLPGAAGRFEVWLRQQPQDQWRALIHRRYKLRFDDLPPSFV